MSATILLTGATGYVGGSLLCRLEREGSRVRCLTRRPHALEGQTAPTTEVALGDLLEPASLSAAMADVDTAYYLVHSMDAAGSFEELDRRAATNFAEAARACGVRHIVYLSGLGSGGNLSPHLASRHEVGDILRASGIATTELRASIVIGVGSASFETVRTLVERLPAIPAPNWVETAAQPIAIDDVIEYLFAAGAMRPRRSAVFEIGGKDRVTYAEVMREYARQRKLRRPVFSLPVVSGRAWRLVLGALIPAHGRVAGAMVDSLRNETVVSDPSARDAFLVRPRGLPEAIARTLAVEDHDFADTSWRDILPEPPTWHWGGSAVRGRMVSSRVLYVSGSPIEVFAPIQRIGGPTGWYGVDWFWQLRGLLDRVRGGEGMRRGRRDPDDLDVGDTIDFWRVERIDPGQRLLLAAEMKLPGRLWLQFDVASNGHTTEIRQTTVFDPAGYIGLAYWYMLYPVHHTIFAAMLRGLRRVLATPRLGKG
ncbi:MAG TPA: SDR family oxidoreductase [Solirubrobacteraceae bacterium]|nr:SDR family oxidoreductase [Solirubrobacteraceae bacterium]